MKQLLVLSGKGGTGKTTIASALIKLMDAKAYADCDVDAPNLHLINKRQEEGIQTDYYGMAKAQIDESLCISCGRCQEVCRFHAINQDISGYKVDFYACEGCGVCEAVCPTKAVTLKEAKAGDLYLYNEAPVFSTAKLKMGNGTSGMLVTQVKEQMRNGAKEEEVSLAIIDGSPGIGCPVIASLVGVDMVLIVTEPSLSGISDMERILKTAKQFDVTPVICINKYDTHLENTGRIEEKCLAEKITLVGKIPYDREAVKAINEGQTIVERVCPSGKAVREVYQVLKDLLEG